MPSRKAKLPKSSSNDDVELGMVSSFKNKLRIGRNKSMLTAKTAEIEAKIVENIAMFAATPSDQVYAFLNPSRPTGLFADEVAQALSTHGKNVISSTAPTSTLKLLLRAIFNPFNILLCILAIISIATGNIATFTIMMIMVVLSTGLRFWQEKKSIMKAARLADMVSPKVRVLRHAGAIVAAANDIDEEHEVEIEKTDVVPGDVVVVASGDVFPGDVVVLSSNSMQVSQSAITGEVFPVKKRPYSHSAPPKINSAADAISCHNICLAGTSVLSGSGHVLVIATGDNSYLASIAEVLSASRPQNAFQIGIRNVSYLLLAFMGVMSPIVLIIRGTISKDWKQAFLFCISVAVGLTPEMLPMIVTSNLALSAVRMSAKKVIVKQLEAIQNLGAITTLCSDKTGTLTLDQIALHTSVDGAGAPFRLPLLFAYLNAHFQEGMRNLLDAAILGCTDDHGSDSTAEGEKKRALLKDLPSGWVKVSEIPFDSSRRMLSIIICRANNPKDEKKKMEEKEGLMITKGAVEEVLEHCKSIHDASPSDAHALESLDGFRSTCKLINDAIRANLMRTSLLLNSQGLRVIAVASKSVVVPCVDSTTKQAMLDDIDEDGDEQYDESNLIFAGFLAFLDPPKPDAADAIERLKKSGVKVVVLTGDAPAVSAKVAMDIGILPSPPIDDDAKELSRTLSTAGVITGSELSAISAKDDASGSRFKAAVRENIVFAKLSPYMKLQIVEALRAQKEVVAFLGDGVNDTMALRGADVGISVDSGTEIAKDAADVILLEKKLGVIADGVVLGRKTLINTIKYIKMAASSNFGNVFSILSASAWLPYTPMAPIQILLQNLLYDFSQASIPWDNVDADTLIMPRNWDVKSILRFMISMGPTSSIFDICIFSLNWFKYKITTLDNPMVALAQTHWFLEGLLTQTLIVYSLRTAKVPFFQSSPSPYVLVTTAMVSTVGICIPYIPGLNSALGFVRPDPMFGGYLVAILTCYMILVQCVKMTYVKIFRDWL